VNAQIRLGRVSGIGIGLHYSWLIIAVLITLSLAGHFRVTNPEWGRGVTWAASLVTGALFFAAILVHELAHCVVAQRRGLPVRSITLFALGGVSQMEKEPPDPRTEFLVGIAGPAASVVIGVVCLGLARPGGWQAAGAPGPPLGAVLGWLGYINVMLALFNMVPGFPLDGGRVLRALLWWHTGDRDRSTRDAARVGQVVAFGFILYGIGRFFGGAGFSGLWISFIGWFLLDAARNSYTQVALNESLRGVRVGSVMDRDCEVIDGRCNLQTFAHEHLLQSGRRCYVVVENGRVEGLITPHEVKTVPRARWSYTTVDDVMRPLAELRTVSPDTPVSEAFELMAREDVNQLPVTSDGHLEGILSRSHLLRLLQTRAELEG
jgi:Zn-dependent protease/CBS domain-containing protein